MWILATFISAFLIGLQDIARKKALVGNSVLLVLLLNVFFCALILSPLVLSSQAGFGWFENNTWLAIPRGSWAAHGWVFLKAVIVLASWLSMYFALKYLPITLTAPIHATYPILTLLGAIVIFSERLNLYQWAGILVSVYSLVLLKQSGKNEGIFFARNKWIWLLGISALFSAASGLYDKFLMRQVHFMFVQSWYTFYQFVLMLVFVGVFARFSKEKIFDFRWHWSILAVSVLMVVSEFFYLYALKDPQVMISMVSMIRRSSVLVSFVGGALLFREKNLRAKAVDLCFVLIGMILLGIGSYISVK